MEESGTQSKTHFGKGIMKTLVDGILDMGASTYAIVLVYGSNFAPCPQFFEALSFKVHIL